VDDDVGSMLTSVGGRTGTEFSQKYACVRAHALWGFTPAELFPPLALSCGYPRTPRLRPRTEPRAVGFEDCRFHAGLRWR
jgi:hypothetical protein